MRAMQPTFVHLRLHSEYSIVDGIARIDDAVAAAAADRTDGLIALSGAHLGDIGHALLADNAGQAKKHAQFWAELFPQRFYIELQRPGQPNAEHYVKRAVRLAAALKLPVVATHPVQFIKRDDFVAHEARVCIAEGYVLSDQRRPRHFTEEQYLKGKAAMAN